MRSTRVASDLNAARRRRADLRCSSVSRAARGRERARARRAGGARRLASQVGDEVAGDPRAVVRSSCERDARRAAGSSPTAARRRRRERGPAASGARRDRRRAGGGRRTPPPPPRPTAPSRDASTRAGGDAREPAERGCEPQRAGARAAARAAQTIASAPRSATLLANSVRCGAIRSAASRPSATRVDARAPTRPAGSSSGR